MLRVRMVGLALLGALLLSGSSAMAQESSFLGRSEVSLQGTGFFTKDSQGNGINQHSTNTGGGLNSYPQHLYRWLSAGTRYGSSRNKPKNLTPRRAFYCPAQLTSAHRGPLCDAPRGCA